MQRAGPVSPSLQEGAMSLRCQETVSDDPGDPALGSLGSRGQEASAGWTGACPWSLGPIIFSSEVPAACLGPDPAGRAGSRPAWHRHWGEGEVDSIPGQARPRTTHPLTAGGPGCVSRPSSPEKRGKGSLLSEVALAPLPAGGAGGRLLDRAGQGLAPALLHHGGEGGVSVHPVACPGGPALNHHAGAVLDGERT